MDDWTPSLAQKTLQEDMARLLSRIGYKRKVLVVDDSVSDRELLGLMLARYNNDIELCDEKVKAVDWIINGKYDLIFLDINMPQDGLKVLEEVMQISPAQRFVIVTGYDEQKLRDSALKLGAVMFITKPVEERQLTAIFGEPKT